LLISGYANITGNINGSNAQFSGNITAGYFIGDGSQLTGLPAQYGDSNVATFLAAYGSNVISTTGNITAGNFVGSGTNVDIVAGSYDWIFANDGNLTLPGNTFAVNYANGTAVSLGGNYGNANVVANLAALGSNPVSTTGNITAGYFLGNGSQLTGISASYGNANVSNFLANGFGSNTITTTGNITAGNLTGNISITGNVTGTSANVDVIAGSYQWTFDNTGNASFANGTVSVTDIDVAETVGFSYESPVANTAIDLTKQISMLSGVSNLSNIASYTLANGSEGQVLFVTWTGVGQRSTIRITTNLRTRDGNQSSYAYLPFDAGGAEINPTNVTLIFSNGYWTTGSTF